ncbi:MAG: cytochrome c biogenesis protein ResB [Verrucomicrobiota bacterium]|jgi:hypothetical protein|nr:cytochrome c biogenesis protein ResB [Verrucomicrobiota bacterium]
MQEIFKPLVKFWCSLKLTVVCLLAALVLVFVGTLAQVDQGLYNAQKKYFRSYLLVSESIGGAGWAQIRFGNTGWNTIPLNWNEIEGSQFSMLDFESVNKENGQRATISVTKFTKGAGGLLANINRWRGQIGLEKVDSLEGTESITIDGNSGRYIEISGTKDGKPVKTLGIIHELQFREPYETWFYKITGDSDIVDREKSNFKTFVLSTSYPTMFKFPFVGGYLVAVVLLINLLAAHFQRFSFSKRKIGIFLTHAGLILMLLGQIVTDQFQVESNMRLEEGQSKNHSISRELCELVIIDKQGPQKDIYASIQAGALFRGKKIQMGDLPFEATVEDYYENSDLTQRDTNSNSPATTGKGLTLMATETDSVTSLDEVNFPSAYVSLKSTDDKNKELGTWLVSALFGALRTPIPEQSFEHEGKEYILALRFKRYYEDYDIKLVDFRHDKFQGTEKARNFSSDVIVREHDSTAERKAHIKMNHPLRTHGKTYFQASFDPENDKATVLQVVRNPGWLTPYISCAMVGLGMLIQFLMHLFSFTKKRKAKA